jgi:solute carrier family 10 (sodium/bile acid cotransporter), member 7
LLSKALKPIDPFVCALFAIVVIASLFPCRGDAAVFFDYLKNASIVVLFFMHGAKLSRQSIVQGMLHTRLHVATLLATFALFPLLGWLMIRMPGVDRSMMPGLLFLTLLPSTVQSSISFTSISKGNVPAAVCAATLSNLLGIFLTPLLVACLMQNTQATNGLGTEFMGSGAKVSLDAIQKICLQLLLPFFIGHLCRTWIGPWVDRHKPILGQLDRGSILLVVYSAFSASIVAGLWARVSWANLITTTLACIVLLLFVFAICWQMGRWLGLDRSERIVLFFCGSKKSLASGVPIAGALFPANEVGLIILPVMIFHQVQIVACAMIAPRLGLANTRNNPG